ncbi:MAG: DUF4430 domain-containing protein [candidate division Zixibacteria bacterium]|nr:DUF4430 domain-containing protein [candidate division Zixibacteria bacterium]
MSRQQSINRLILLLAVALIIHGCGKQQEAEPLDRAQDSASATETPGRDSVTFELAGQDSVTAFELLQRAHYVEFRSTAMGLFVTGIDSVQGGGNAFWIYTVNDTTPKTASDKMFTRTGDRVVWRLRLQSE